MRNLSTKLIKLCSLIQCCPNTNKQINKSHCHNVITFTHSITQRTITVQFLKCSEASLNEESLVYFRSIWWCFWDFPVTVTQGRESGLGRVAHRLLSVACSWFLGYRTVNNWLPLLTHARCSWAPNWNFPATPSLNLKTCERDTCPTNSWKI